MTPISILYTYKNTTSTNNQEHKTTNTYKTPIY